MTAPSDAFAVHALLVGCVAEVSLNDVPLVTARLRREQASVHATPWVIDGTNELRIRIEDTRRLTILPMGATAADPEAGPVMGWARVMAGRYESLVPDPDSDPTLVEIAWGPVDDAARALPQVVTGTFVATDRPRWAWQDAPRIDVAASEARAELLAFVRAIHAAFAARDPGAVLARMPTLVRESTHFGPSSQDFAGAFAGEFTRQTSDADFAVAPLVEDEVVFRSIAGGRAVRVLDASGASVLRAAPASPEPWSFRLDVARIDGRLELARIG